MAKEKKSFIVYQSWRAAFELLNENEKATFITNLFKFNNNEEIVLDTPMLNMFWKSIEYNLYENDKRYKTSVENGSKGGAPKGNQNAKKQPNQPNSTQKQPNQLSVEQNNLNDNDNDNVNDNVKEKVKDKEKEDVKQNDKQVNIADKHLTNLSKLYYDESNVLEAKKLLDFIITEYGSYENILNLRFPNDISVQNNWLKLKNNILTT